jgi:hypothetical protein
MLDENILTLPSAVYIRERLDYDPATGLFLWRRHDAMPNKWNGRWAGNVAGRTCHKGYRQIAIANSRHSAHRIAWLMMTGEWPKADIDHINGVRDDNRFSNLREATRAENNRNASMQKRNASGVSGVSWHKMARKWQANISVGHRRIHLGLFSDITAAAAARKTAEIEHGFHPNHGRGLSPVLLLVEYMKNVAAP